MDEAFENASSSTRDRAPGDAVTLQLYSALQNSPSSVSTRRACSLTNSVSASCLLSGKQTPSSVPCVQSKSFHNLFSTVRSHPPLQGEWNFPQICGLGRWGDTGLLAVMLWDPNSASRYNLRIAGGLVVCQCGLYIQSHVSVPHTGLVLPLSTHTYFLKQLQQCAQLVPASRPVHTLVA